MNKVNVGVIGVGVLGRHHVRLYRGCTGAELVGVHDSNSETAQAVAAEFGTRVFATEAELAAAAQAVSVAVPTDLHFEVVARLLKQDKHVLVEKPLTAAAAEGRELVKLADERGLALQVGHVEQFNPVITYLEEKIAAPLFIEAHRLASYPPPRPGLKPRGTEVGVVHDLMIHDLDLILHLVGGEVVQLEAVGLPVLSASEDIAQARLTFANGCVANITASRLSPERMRKIRVFQPTGYLSLDYGEQQGELYTKTATGIKRETVPIASGNALQIELEDFIRCAAAAIATGVLPEPTVSGKRAQRALELADEIVESLNEHNRKYHRT